MGLESFYEESMELTKLLKQEIGDDCIVRYVKAYKDDVTDGFDKVEMTVFGDVIPLV